MADEEFIASNLNTLLSMIEEVQQVMSSSLDEGRTLKEDGGYILKYDPNQRSFKAALNLIILVGAALEAMWHIQAVKLQSKTFAENTDRDCKSVSEKFVRIGVNDTELLARMNRYYAVRRQILHEKAHSASYKKSLFTAQKEAASAYNLLIEIRVQLASIHA